jgi:hypothetical protein
MIVRMSRVLPVTALSAVVIACTEPTDPTDYLATETAETTYSSGAEGVGVSFTVTNLNTRETYYVGACDDRVLAAVERREGGRWVNAAAAICLGIYSSAPIVLGPGQRTESIVGVSGAGLFRLRLVVARDRERQTSWMESSNSFIVR